MALAPSVEKRIRGERKPLSMPDSLIFGRQRADSEKNLNGRSLDAFAHSSAAGYGGVSDSWVHRQQRLAGF
ncbi:hypothetical protein Tcan_11611 [Toxocara canis]|uniref:Uncharacterized protein n=1 Tax=Toxocara canis TaxID=6265 RepID=A0A0B2VSZ5_TOXCA|nr:hypothetical protein Tcan_11611 [Toxocara canis]